jgi:ribonuclease HI
VTSDPKIPKKDNWQRMRFKNNKVWMALDDRGQPLVQNGKFLIKYQLDQEHEYWVRPASVRPLDEAPDPGPSAAAAGRQARRRSPSPAAAGIAAAGNQNAICLYTDGASSGNPGPSGIGVLMRYKGHEKEISRYIGLATNNIAELEAIRAGLTAVKNRSVPVRVFTDSSYAYGLLALGWKPKKNQDLIAAIVKLMQTFKDLRLTKVRGHAGHPENERADQLATAAIRSAKSGP